MNYWFILLTLAAGWSFCLIFQELQYKWGLRSLKKGIEELKAVSEDLDIDTTGLEEEIETIEEMEVIIETAETLAYWLEMIQKGRLKVDKKLTRDEWLDVAVTAVENPKSVELKKDKKDDNKKSRD